MKTPAFNDFEYLHSKINLDLEKGFYTLKINYWENLLLK